jgi:hypothetical protein
VLALGVAVSLIALILLLPITAPRRMHQEPT